MSTKSKQKWNVDESAKLNRRLIPKNEVPAFQKLLAYILKHSETKTIALRFIGLSWRQASDVDSGHITFLNAKRINKAYNEMKAKK